MPAKFSKILCAGTFDNFHVGHQFFLWNAQGFADQMVVILARDKTVFSIKNRLPKNDENARAERVCREFSAQKNDQIKVRLGRRDADFFRTISEENPDVIFLGFDQKFDQKKCSKIFPRIKIVRSKKYFPEFFKSSKFLKF